MVGAVQVDAIPTRRETNSGSNTARTCFCRKFYTVHSFIRARSLVVTSKIGLVVAPKAYRIPLRHAAGLPLLCMSSQHAEAWLERSDLGVIVCRCIVHRHAPNFAIEEAIWDLGNAFEGPVASLEVHVGRPVVGLILRERACCASCDLGNIRTRDGGGESIAAHDLVDVW